MFPNGNPWQQPTNPVSGQLWQQQQKVNGMVMKSMQEEETRLAALNNASMAAREANNRTVAQEINQSTASMAAYNAIDSARNQTNLDTETKTMTVIDQERLKPTKKDLIKFVFEKLIAKKTKELDERRAIEKKMESEIDALKEEHKTITKELVKEEVGHMIDQINVLLKTKFPKTQLSLRFYNYSEKIEVTVYMEGGTNDHFHIEESETFKQKTADLNALIEKKQKTFKAYKDITLRISNLVYQHNPTVTTIIDAACSSFSSAEIESLNNILMHLDFIIHKQWEPDFEEDPFFTEHPVEATIECEVVKPDKVITVKAASNEYYD